MNYSCTLRRRYVFGRMTFWRFGECVADNCSAIFRQRTAKSGTGMSQRTIKSNRKVPERIGILGVGSIDSVAQSSAENFEKTVKR